MVANGSLEDKQLQLGVALALANKKEVDVSPDAQQAWREISEASTIHSMLVQANSSGRRRLLDIAVARAQKTRGVANATGPVSLMTPIKHSPCVGGAAATSHTRT